MNRTWNAAACMLIALTTSGWGAETDLGICDSSAPREKRTLQYNVEARNDREAEFVAKRPCSDDVVVIRSCAVINVQKKKVQRYCYPENRPAHYEFFDIVEYWGTAVKSNKPQ